ncbi:MAG: GerMN domain-containing protein [Lachnospiraceae bacterium]|nr:GerMN domain-containing protein [Lachnospiraceae bacterium]
MLRFKNKIVYKLHILGLAVLLLMLPILSYGCSSIKRGQNGEPSSETQKQYVYYINRDKTRVQGEEYTFTETETKAQIEEMVNALAKNPVHKELRSSMNNNFSLIDYSLKDEILTLNLSPEYKELSPNEEILVRAALVRSFVQIEGVQYVQFLVEGETLNDAAGLAVGLLNADSFIENDGKEINAYERVSVTLYFATLDGKNLISGQRSVVYNTNVSMEKMVMEQLIKGPQVAGYYPTINPETKILSVINKDGTCYVNLSEDFLKQTYDVTTDVVLYSIANSLIDLSNVSRVQIQIGGTSQIVYRETVSLETPLERNLDIVLKEESQEE